MMHSLARIVLVTGKGGVGKTSVAAGLATLAARSGRRAIFVEFGDGESGKRAMTDSVRGVEHRVITSAKAVQAAADDMFGSAIVARAVTGNFAVKRMLRAAPALRELAQLEYVRSVAEKHPDHLVVVDMPASGHGLAWLRVPAKLRDLLVTGPMHRIADRVHREVTSPGKASVVLVSLPELLVLEETVELATSLRRDMGITAARVIVNRVPAPVSADALRIVTEQAAENPDPDREKLLRFLEARAGARAEVNAALDRADLASTGAPILLPLWPVDPSNTEIATWIGTGAEVA
ncbi:MAG: ArsA-related P-loop ATPase [Polyangiales bacterium]|nr:hypothetical protein [Myxococcales bacterium]